MSKLRLTLACWNYDRTRGLADGSVQPDGVELTYLNLPVEETFFRMLRYREFEAAEMSLSSYTVSLFGGDPPFVAIPVFPSRSFRHNAIFVSTKSGVREPKDLIGKRVGNPEYQLTAQVWVRGILSDEYGIPPSSVEYWTGGEEEPGREEKIALDLPPEFRVRRIGPNQTLSRMLADGDLDALYAPRIPSTLALRPKDVRRLFENYAEVEHAYFSKTKIFPIMHTVVIRRDIYRACPWVAQSLYKAFARSQRLVYKDLEQTAALKTMLPWLSAHVEELKRTMGDDWWPYGFEPNQHVIETFLRYHHEQGLSKRRLRPEELFAPETLSTYKI
ncbi:MAG TPA: ABC transporter substrate-binding protein [Thermodesulfobacteriota bacterium]|nr:ABC transporter substrate-binding protein [Thermodesulfobacteriota bacterium]